MTILERIIESKQAEVAAARVDKPVAELERIIRDIEPPRDFYRALLSADDAHTVRLIAEIKKASPSAGLIVPDFDSVAIARQYEAHGAAALSVLTDEPWFQGRLEYIAAVRRAVPLPVLRKDFVIEAYQVYEARAAGADAVLLIAEVLDTGEIVELHTLAGALGLAVLIEVHAERNLVSLLDTLGPPRGGHYLLGINNRNLAEQRTDVQTTVRLAARLPRGCPFVSESGLATRADIRTVQQAGAVAVLIGESLLKSPDMGRKIDELFGMD